MSVKCERLQSFARNFRASLHGRLVEITHQNIVSQSVESFLLFL